MRIIVILAVIVIASYSLNAQNKIEGKVLELSNDGSIEPIFGANVYWEGTNVGTVTDIKGHYSINEAVSFPATLSVSYVGYTFDSKEVVDDKYIFYLKSLVELNTIQVEGKVNTTKLSLINPINTQILSTEELQKAACCNLSESFQTNTTVDVFHSDAITGLKKIRMLGLDGSYVQITNENMPLIRGLQRSYGLTYVPGSWIESIQIIKGMGSVVNGYESFAGQINLEYFKPFNANKIFWNAYTNTDGMIENNLLVAKKKGKWQSNLFTHFSYFDKEVDHNGKHHNDNTHTDHSGDGFLDMPRVKQFNFLNRWQYLGSDFYRAQINFRGSIEDRIAGQKEGASNRYIADIDNRLLNVYAKLGTINKDGKSIAIQTSFLVHQQDAQFGNNSYKGLQQSGYVNLILERRLDDIHSLRYGLSYYADRFTENLDGNINTPYDKLRTDLISGIYLEHTYGISEIFKLVSGVRSDYYNITNKLYYSPRTNLRYSPSENTVLRLSVGKAFRIAQPIVENLNYLNSSRSITLDSNILPEEAVNFGINATYCFNLFSRDGTVNLDIYRTEFQNQVVVDIEEQDKLLFYNLSGSSYSNNIQLGLDYELISGLQMRLGYNINNTINTFNGEQKLVPLLPDYKALFNLAYTNNSKKWLFDFTINYIGSSRIPVHDKLDYEYSEQFSLINCNITRKWDQFDFYVGAENITNYMQNKPIIGSDDWSSSLSSFDASLVYAPVNGRMIYLGFRYRIE
jgi:hypothetical protein